jgi:hypothetical protein
MGGGLTELLLLRIAMPPERRKRDGFSPPHFRTSPGHAPVGRNGVGLPLDIRSLALAQSDSPRGRRVRHVLRSLNLPPEVGF